MKFTVLLLSVYICTIGCVAQSTIKDNQVNYPLVRVKDWNSKAMVIVEEAWESNKDQIVAQLGQKDFEKVKNNYDYKSIPDQMTIWSGGRRKTLQEVNQKLDSLRVMYKIASFNYIFQGKDWGKRAILMVPYKGNENWDKTAKWDTVYFILDEEAVEEISR